MGVVSPTLPGVDGEMMREDELDDAGFQSREVYALFGLAVYQGQVLETGLANVLTLAQTVGVPGATRDTFDGFMEANLRVTMGRLVNLLGPFLQEDHDLLSDLRSTLETRNRLAHHFFRDHDQDFLSFTGREVMLAELIEARASFEEVDARLMPVLDRYFAHRGIDSETRARMVAEMYEELHRSAVAADEP
jgi:hypothetical protein